MLASPPPAPTLTRDVTGAVSSLVIVAVAVPEALAPA